MKKKIVVASISILIILSGFLIWYKLTYSMDTLTLETINKENSGHRLLIASQGSEYKNAIVDGIIENIKSKDLFIQIIDVEKLESVDPDEWNVIVVIHTWEIWEPQQDAATFLKIHYDPEKVFVLATSGSGEEMIEGVDGITGASEMEDVDEKVNYFTDKISDIFGWN